MNIQQKNSAHHFRMQSEREQTLVFGKSLGIIFHGHKLRNFNTSSMNFK